MKKLLPALFLCLNILIVQAQNPPVPASKLFKLPKYVTVKDYVPGVLIVKFKAVAGSSSKTKSVTVPDHNVKSRSVVSQRKMFSQPISSLRTSALRKPDDEVGLGRIYEVKISTSANIEAVINEILADPNVEYAEPRYIHRINYLPSDPRFPEQTYLPQLHAPQAWDLVRNGSGLIIAIVDSGSELTHPDLAANIYYNTADPVNQVDDDGNGKVDDYRGWDFAGDNGFNEDNNPNVVGSSNDHGVHVSGIASAVTDNGTGVSSIAFNTAKLLIVKAGPDNNGTEISRGYEGIKYAADMGAHIINCSWGSTSGGGFGRDVVNYAIGKGCLVVAAGGNSNTDVPEYPAAYKGVLAVANVNADKTRASSSNYGPYISISAPGNQVLSTVFGGYGLSSGSSMSAPIVSSTAALVKAYRPAFNMQQIGELVRVTADNTENENPQFTRQLGKGRVNVLKALTETPPSVRIQNVSEEEKIAANAGSPDTLYLYLDLKNFLYPVSNLKLTLSASIPEIKILSSVPNIASIGTLETKTQVGPFKVIIPKEVPGNSNVDFLLTYAANNYQDFEWFSLTVSKDFINIRTNSIATTITSNGRIGYSSPSETNGLGFEYRGEQLLYEAALMIGNSPERVSNNARADNSTTHDHFVKLVRAYEVIDNADSIVAESQFNDRGNPQGLEIAVTHRMTAFKKSPDDKYIIAEYEVLNRTNFQLKNVHIGLFTDWDILGGRADATQYIPAERLAYVYDKEVPNAPYAAVKLLNNNAAPAYYPLSFDVQNNPLSDEELTIAEKWETLSSGVQSSGLDVSTGVDVSFVSGYGPYSIPANGSVKVAFAFIGGDNLQDIQASAQAAQQKYDKLNVVIPNEPAVAFNVEVYPNPLFSSNGVSTVRFELPEQGKVTLELFNLMGQRVRTLIPGLGYGKGVHYLKYDFSGGFFSDIGSGVYFYRFKYNDQVRTTKISVLK